MIQIPLTDVNCLLSKVSKGNRMTIEVEDEKYNVIFKNITHEPVRQQVEHIEFQHIVADEAVNSVVKVVLTNKEKSQSIIQQHIDEIPYKALPRNFVQEIVIDVDGMKAGTIVKIEDLDIAKNEDIKLAIPEDTIIVTVAEKKRMVMEETDEEQGSSIL